MWNHMSGKSHKYICLIVWNGRIHIATGEGGKFGNLDLKRVKMKEKLQSKYTGMRTTASKMDLKMD